MGIVFRARRETDGKTVALKVLRGELAESPVYRRRFEREARVAREVANERIVPVIDYGDASGRLYIAAPYVPGVSLAAHIASLGPLSSTETFRVVSHLADALDTLHSRGLVHRDVKPANVLLDERGAAALTDFGLARSDADTVLTKTGLVVGTVDYLAPELIQGERASPQSDVYALGCLVYECLAGFPPFGGKSFVEALLAHVRDEPPDLTEVRADLPQTTCWAVTKALAKDPVERPPTATAYARLLRASAKTA